MAGYPEFQVDISKHKQGSGVKPNCLYLSKETVRWRGNVRDNCADLSHNELDLVNRC